MCRLSLRPQTLQFLLLKRERGLEMRTPTRCALPSIHKACEDVRAKFMQTFESGTRVIRVYERNTDVDT